MSRTTSYKAIHSDVWLAKFKTLNVDSTVRILVCGSRTYDDTENIRYALDCALRKFPNLIVITGGAQGADLIATNWALLKSEDHNVKLEVYPADWKRYRRSAGPKRNAQMLSEGKPDIVLAFTDKPIEESRGTSNMVRQADKANVPVYLYR